MHKVSTVNVRSGAADAVASGKEMASFCQGKNKLLQCHVRCGEGRSHERGSRVSQFRYVHSPWGGEHRGHTGALSRSTRQREKGQMWVDAFLVLSGRDGLRRFRTGQRCVRAVPCQARVPCDCSSLRFGLSKVFGCIWVSQMLLEKS